jgi:outer membrane protein TolC
MQLVESSAAARRGGTAQVFTAQVFTPQVFKAQVFKALRPGGRPARAGWVVAAWVMVLFSWPSGVEAASRGAEGDAALSSAPASVAEARSRSAETLALEAAVQEAVAKNPGLAERDARARAMAAIPPQLGTLPDPMVSVSALNFPVDTFSFNQEPMTQLRFGVSQAVPFPGKLGLRETAAWHEAEAASSDVEESRLRLIRGVKSRWWGLFYLDRALDTVKRNQDLLRQLVEIAQTKYEVGQGLQQDVLLAQVELSKLLDLEIRLTGMRRTGEARLDALLDRPTDSPIHLPDEVDTTLPRVAPEAVLMDAAEDNRPLLLSRRKKVDAARTREALAQKDYYPDFKFSAGYGIREGTNPMTRDEWPDFFTVGASMNVPIFTGTKQDKAADQRRAELRQQKLALQDSRTQVGEEISSALADFERAAEQVTLLKTGIVPQAQQTVASMRAGYLVNKVDFLNLVRAQITVYDYETQYWRALSEANQALAALAAAVGKEEIHE